MTWQSPPIIQIVAYVANLALFIAAWKLPRTRLYVGAMLGADLLRVAFGCVPLRHERSDMVLYALDGALLLAPIVALAHALRVHVTPVAGALLCVFVACMRMVEQHGMDRAADVYVVALLTTQLYLTFAPLMSRTVRREMSIDVAMLIGLAATGTTGAVVALAWKDWELVNAGNVLTHLSLALLAFFACRGDE